MKAKLLWFLFPIITTSFSCANEIYKKDLNSYSPGEKKQISHWIQKLSSPSWRERSGAAHQLIQRGPFFIPLFQSHLFRANVEQNWRIRSVLSQLGWVEPGLQRRIEKNMAQIIREDREMGFQEKNSKKEEILSYGQVILPLLLTKLKASQSHFDVKNLCLDLMVEMENPRAALPLGPLLLKPNHLHSRISIALGNLHNLQSIPYLAYGLFQHHKYYGGFPFCGSSLLNLMGPSAFPFLLSYWQSKAPFRYKEEVLQLFLQTLQNPNRREIVGGNGRKKFSPKKFREELERLKKWWDSKKNHFWNLKYEGYFKKYQKIVQNGRCQT